MLSDPPPHGVFRGSIPRSQCTFWCSVLSDWNFLFFDLMQAFVSMHLLVLSAFRPTDSEVKVLDSKTSQCTFWCSVLSDMENIRTGFTITGSQCTFWCSVLSDSRTTNAESSAGRVSMHLLVLSAFRPRATVCGGLVRKVSMHLLVLSAFRLVFSFV